MPVISNIVYTVTDTTVVATWTTDTASDSNLFAGAKAAIDNGVAANSTSHQCVVTGLSPNETYACHVTSGGTSSANTVVKTSAPRTRTPILSATNSAVTQTQNTSTNWGDTFHNFVADDNSTYITQGDGVGIAAVANAGAAVQVDKITNESTFLGSTVNLLTACGANGSFNGTDGPGGIALTNKPTGIMSMGGKLFLWVDRQTPGNSTFPFVGQYSAMSFMSADHGATWNNWQNPGTFNAAGIMPSPVGTSFIYASQNYGWSSPVRYAKDDGTLGYNTAGNQIDGANGWVYLTFQDNSVVTGTASGNSVYLLRIARVQLAAQNFTSTVQYWKGPASPSPQDFVNDSNWSTSDAGKTSIYNFAANFAWPVITFIPTINYYLMTTYFQTYIGSGVGGFGTTTRFAFLAGPTPAGPWTPIFQSNHSSTTEFYDPFPMHRDAAENVLTDSIPIRVLFSGKQTTFYQVNVSTLTLATSGTPFSLAWQAADNCFRANENPLSNGGAWTGVATAVFTGTNQLTTDQIQTVTSTQFSISKWNSGAGAGGAAWPNDHYGEIQVAGAIATGKGCVIVLRLTGSGGTVTFYDAFVGGGTNSTQLNKTVNNSRTNLTSVTTTPAVGDIWRFSVVGSTLTLTQNGISRTSTTDSAVTTGVPGVGVGGPTAMAAVELWMAGANGTYPPNISPGGGSYLTPTVTVTLTSPSSGATIFYTTDGSTPTHSSSSVANGGTVVVAIGATVKALASVSGSLDSVVNSATFAASTGPPVGGAGAQCDMLWMSRPWVSRVQS